MPDGFLGRWSRRKLDVKEGRAPEPEPPPTAPPEPLQARAIPEAPAGPLAPAPAAPAGSPESPAEAPPPPSLEDVRALTPEADFSRFMASDVTPEVRNAAVKKLFEDPHFNVMDGLDVYIDDYGKPDPLPESMLRNLASAEFLGLFREDPAAQVADAATREAADTAEGATVPESQAPENRQPEGDPAADSGDAVPERPSQDADPDLRLQQDHAAGPRGPGQGPA
ncbi:DUF3306 domain-containing protein [Ramlibacter sp. AW1]|uniref:DUF3306 domain-containing protein n=1 Tax=Ramlibacter aurantiacus TaxID=2801330 RepID=A0A936ZH26_9BURK|nr:DUF3306 domain-containing protein [Ramlibacter aurantiacus]MBL0420118.1 DUF3306 domain-containing protein [Ramlibacter aurantiacus]